MTVQSERRATSANAEERTVAPMVLVVEDEVLTRISIVSYLCDRGYHVIQASSGDEAVATMHRESRVDVVFTDVRMPGSLDGFALARWIRRERPAVQVILTTGAANEVSRASAEACGCPLLAKPYDPAQVEHWIDRTLPGLRRR